MADNKNNYDAGKIVIKGARTHNLKNVSVELPRGTMIVFTGLSGSGKSSLAFDTIFAEGQRKYVESLSAYARQFLRQMQKPEVDEITGLSPAISIDQKSRSNNPRSTVATITEIYDYLRVLYARIGHPHCPQCGREVKKLSNEEILEAVLEIVENSATQKKALPSSAKASAGSSKKLIAGVSGLKIRISAPVVVGRKGEYYQLLYDMLGKGYEKVVIDGADKSLRERIVLEKNDRHDIDIVVDEIFVSEFKDDIKGSLERASEAIERALTESDGLVRITDAAGVSRVVSAKFMCAYDGFSFPEVEPRLFSFNSPYGACPECKGIGTKYLYSDEVCEMCQGARLRDEALNVFLGPVEAPLNHKGKAAGTNIVNLSSLSIEDAMKFFNSLKLTRKEQDISRQLIKEISARLQFMLSVGIEYLTLDRKANTLSGGEAQRIRLASQLGSGLVGALYVLDEPTIGLHQRDNDKLIETLKRLRDLGNTVLVVEHDEDTIYASDYIVDIGPGAGVHGGAIVAAGWLDELLTAKTNKSGSRTLAYLREEIRIEVPKERRTADRGKLKIRGATKFNLKNVNVDIPLGKLVGITGVSGSGKSTFLYEILHRNLLARFDKRFRTAKLYNVKEFSGTEYMGRSILIDQSPIGRTPRSNPATYTGAWTHIRDMFAMSEESRARGWGPGRFSFNVKGGRCEACQGNGLVAVEMHFLPTVYVTCDVCNGKRFMKETLDVKFKKKSIHDILSMTVEEAMTFFEDIPAIHDRLKTLSDVGLAYLELGQSATTLSGGEAQRVKIASELYRPHITKSIYLLDEPTVGLHYDDVAKLIDILQELVRRGNTVVVIEHSLDILKSADYLIDMGPEGGIGGGTVVATGTPEEVAKTDGSHTGYYLKKVLKRDKK
jgi:excinuclease ABC subunit A